MLLLRTRQESVKEFGVVYRAYLKDIKQTVALKSLDFDTEHSFDNIATEVKYTTKVNYSSGDLRCYLNPFNNNSKLTPSEKLEIQVRKIHGQRQFESLTLDH
ncbi:hypothetical protein F8M41_022107 [Gigaspora margarita]|uniref:Uncharacterized protein n=1 Tax=Gigaspora margarita TaxID=4874 RepID=A0A8H4EIA4_GIGMA|nr:hypothetical protein F8M41_022107 [Gigaspora margarita]